MASLFAGSDLLDDGLKRHVIMVIRGEVFVADDVPSSPAPEAEENDAGRLRILQRTIYSAEEFHPFVEIPFLLYTSCSSTECFDCTSSKAIYAVDRRKKFIYALAYGREIESGEVDLVLFKISTQTGLHSKYRLSDMQMQGDGGNWEMCSFCRGTKMEVVYAEIEGEESTKLVVFNTVLIPRRRHLATFPIEHAFEECQVWELIVDEANKQFSVDVDLFSLPFNCDGMDVGLCVMDKSCTKWAGIEHSGSLLIYDSPSCSVENYRPSKRAEQLITKFSRSKHLKLAEVGGLLTTSSEEGDANPQLELMVEPDLWETNGSKSDRRFFIYQINFHKPSMTYRVKLARTSIPIPHDVDLRSIIYSNCAPGEAFIDEGRIYKFYGKHALLTFLRAPSLVEASFVAFNVDCSNLYAKKFGIKAAERGPHGVTLYGMGQMLLNDELDREFFWFI